MIKNFIDKLLGKPSLAKVAKVAKKIAPASSTKNTSSAKQGQSPLGKRIEVPVGNDRCTASRAFLTVSMRSP